MPRPPVSSRAPTPARREILRAELLAARTNFANSEEARVAEGEVNAHLSELLAALEPELLGVYWAVRGEFKLARVIARVAAEEAAGLALPYAQAIVQTPAEPGASTMDYRAWDGHEPTVTDGCGIPSGAGAPVRPDVVIVPCVGFTRSGYRLGYGGGFFDRWLAAHPHVTAIGVAWSGLEVDEGVFAPQPHDIPMSIVVTERGVVG